MCLTRSVSSDMCDVFKSFIPPEVANGFDKPLDASDYKEYLDKCGSEFSQLKSSLSLHFQEHPPLPLTKHNIDLISTIVIVCAAHSKPHLWSSYMSVQTSRALLKCLVDACQLNSVQEVLMFERAVVLKNVLKVLRPKLLKTTWKMNIPAVEVYEWLLFKIEASLLIELLDDVLPTAFIVADDFEVQNRVKAVRCFNYITSNVERTDLIHGERCELIYNTLQPMLSSKEADVIQVLYPCLVSFFTKMSSQDAHDSTEYGSKDEVLEAILTSMYSVSTLAVRDAYISVLPSIITTCAVPSLRHTSLLLDVLEEYILEPSSAMKAFQCLEAFLKVAWPLIRTYYVRILIFLLKILRDSTMPRSYHNNDACNEVERLLKVICELEPSVQELLRGALEKITFHPDFTASLMSVIDQFP